MTIVSPKKLIEVALPLDAINAASAREKSIRHGHPSTLHLWWARRPLATARAVIFSQLVNDPEDLWTCQYPGVEPNKQVKGHWTKARARLFKIIEDLVLWENTTNEAVLNPAREAIRQSWREVCELNKNHPRAKELFDPAKMPGLHDPFAGGGSIPLEAQRLGLEAYASDLNPVAVLINKAMIEIPPKFANRPPVCPVGPAVASGPRTSRPLFGDPLHPSDFPDAAWKSRGYLPHLDHPGVVQSVTFRLADSVPAKVTAGWKAELKIRVAKSIKADDPRMIELRKRIARFEDAGHGQCCLKHPAIAKLVQDALLHFDGERYRLLAWCVMPNHVHVVFETRPGHELADVVQAWKSFTAKQANKLLKRTGAFWEEDYFDRFVRNAEHYENVVAYVEQNPVEAGLVGTAAAWPYSSAAGRGGEAPVIAEAGGTPALPGQGAPLLGPRASRPLSSQAGETPALPGLLGQWTGAAGLAEDVRRYGRWMRDEAFQRIGHLYPPVEITTAMVKERPDLKPYEGEKLTVIAWLWARTVKSPNPAFSHVDVPLASTFVLSSKPGKEAYVQPVILGPRASRPLSAQAGETPAVPGYAFTVKAGTPPDEAKAGTSFGKQKGFRCLMSQTPTSYEYIREEALARRMGQKLMAIVAEGARGRVYLSPTAEQETLAATAKPKWKPDLKIPDHALGFRVQLYGMMTFGDLFTPRQLVALTTFSDLVGEARERIEKDALVAGMSKDGNGLDAGGTGARAYAEAVSVYLGFVIEKMAESHSTICTWSNSPKNELVVSTFRRQALPMTWDFGEANAFAVSVHGG